MSPDQAMLTEVLQQLRQFVERVFVPSDEQILQTISELEAAEAAVE